MIDTRTAQAKGHARRLLAAVAATCFLFAGGGEALAGSTDRADFLLRFPTKTPGHGTAVDLHILYKAAGDPNAKPSPLRRVVIDAPSGTRFHGDRFPRCTASDEELRARGRGACPAAALVGRGPLTVMTGFGPPIDPVRTDVWIYNTATGFVEVVQQPGRDVTLGMDRFTVMGNRLTASPPSTPGGPPDGRSAVRQVDFDFFGASSARPAYVTTPPSCPASGRWASRAEFTFADGATTVVRDSTPCNRSSRSRPRLGLRLTGRTRRLRGRRRCFRGRVRATVTGRDRRLGRRAEFFVGPRRMARDRRPPLSRIVDRMRHRGRSHLHVARARVRLSDGRLVRLRRRYRSCGER